MPARALVLFPDPRLMRPAAPVDGFGPTLTALADDVRDTLMAASAIGLALSMGIPQQVTIRTDLTMTVLLHNALRGSAGATLVLSNLIRRMPIDRADRRRLATSWLAHNFRQAWPELDERLRIVKAGTHRRGDDGEDLS